MPALKLILIGLLLPWVAFAQGTPSNAAKGLPLEPARALDFDLDQGSWLSVDVTPDGGSVVFDLLGDLYRIPLAGGDATQLTRGMAFDAQPRVSPDGKWVAFTSDRDGAENVWIRELTTGQARQITRFRDKTIQSPEWSPDGKYLFATVADIAFGPGKLWMFHLDGGSGMQLTRDPPGPSSPFAGTMQIGVAFGRDPRYLWFAERTGLWQYNAILPQYQLVLYDRDTGAREVRTSHHGSGLRPTLSPDGKWLAYASRYEAKTGLLLQSLGTGEERWLAYPVQRDDQEAIPGRDTYPGMSFTPDSRELVASYGGKIWRIPVAGGAAVPVPFRVRTRIELGPRPTFKYPISDSTELTVRQIRDLAPSPDGKRLAFVALDRAYLVDAAGGTPERLTRLDQIEAQPVWSPDGRWIAFAAWKDSAGAVYKVPVDRRAPPVALTTDGGAYLELAWSPEGARLAAVRAPAAAHRAADGIFARTLGQELVAVPAAGGPVERIAPSLGRLHPHFTGDSSRIYLWAGAKGLVSIRWDGTDERRHLTINPPLLLNEEKPAPPGFVRLSPTGEQALVRWGFDLFTVTVPTTMPSVGGEPPAISLQTLETAATPARRLTDVGSEFAVWSADGRRVHWGIGNASVIYDLDSARAFDRPGRGSTGIDSSAGPRYRPRETRIVVRAPRDLPRGTIVLRGARVVTMRGDEVVDDADVVVRDNRIRRVGPRGEVPAGARVVDVAGKTIIPGFIDLHAHMYPAHGLHNEQPWTYLANLAYGVTTTRDPSPESDVLSYQDMVESGAMLGPRIFSTGPAIHYGTEQIRDLEHAREVLRRYAEYWRTNYIKMYVKGNRQVRQWIVMAAKEAGITPTTEGALDSEYDLTLLLDGYAGQEHATPTVPLYRDVIDLYARSGTTYTPTLLVQFNGPYAEDWYFQRENPYHDPKVRRFMPYEQLAPKTRRRGGGIAPGAWFMEDEYIFRETAAVGAAIVRAGGKVGVGSHGEFDGLGYHWELWSVGSGGMSPHEALRAATLTGAEALGLDADLGSIEEGKLADLLVLDRNPLESLRHTNTIRYVMKNGRLYLGDTLDELWPRQRKQKPPFGLVEVPRGLPGVKD